MKAFYKILGLTLASALVFASCAKEDPYSPGKPAGSEDVYFSADNDNTVILGLDATEFVLYLERTNSGSNATVPVSSWCDTEGIISVPETVTFAAGETIAPLTVKVNNMEPFTNYQMNVSIPEEYTQPYKEETHASQCGFVFYKEDYVPAATCMYYDDFWYEEEWEEIIYYSPMLDLYRINAFPGGSFTFTWDGGSKVAFGNKVAISTGYVHSSYGAITATPTSCGYDEENEELVFMFKWTVSAGSFGEYGQYVYDIKWKN